MLNIATHNGTITLTNPKTGNHRTIQIRTQPNNATFAPGKRIISLLTGPNNETNYQPFGFVTETGQINLWRKKQTQTYQTYANMITNPQHYQTQGITYLTEGRCRICNRKLTTPESIQSGIGPICAKLRA